MAGFRIALIAAGTLALACTAAQARGGGHYGFRRSYSHASTGNHYTHSYFRRNGTYVHGYHATNQNSTRNDNYSTRGNVNPYTGTAGTKPRDGE